MKVFERRRYLEALKLAFERHGFEFRGEGTYYCPVFHPEDPQKLILADVVLKTGLSPFWGRGLPITLYSKKYRERLLAVLAELEPQLKLEFLVSDETGPDGDVDANGK